MGGSAGGTVEAWARERNGKVTYYEGKMKLGFQLGLTCGIPPILVSDGGQEVVRDLVTE